MSFEVLLGKSSREAYDVTELVGSTDITDNINKSSVCTFLMIVDEILPEEGNAVMVSYDGTNYFTGYIVSTVATQEQLIKVTAYDQLFYLKATDARVFSNLPLDKIVGQLGQEFGLRVGVLEATDYPLGRLIYDGKQLLDIIANGITLTLRGTGELYYIKDAGGYLVLKNIRSAISDIALAPEGLLTGYSYTRSIDGETYNQIKLVRDNKDTGKRELFITKDSSTISKWGLLQYYEKLDDQANPAQAKEKADALLQLKNRVKQTLSANSIGDSSIRAGNVICAQIPSIGVDKFLLCTSAKHQFANAGHTVKVDLRLV